MNEPPQTWACGHAMPVDPYSIGDRLEREIRVAKEVKWGERCPVCGLSYSEHKALTERPTK